MYHFALVALMALAVLKVVDVLTDNVEALQRFRSLLTIAFDSMDLHRVMATCDPRNLASAAVLHKVGMTFEGRLRHTMMIRDGWRDSSVFSILADEWQARRD